SRVSVGLWIDQHPLTDLLQTFDHHTFARLRTLADDPVDADRVAKRHGSNRYLVAAVNDRDLARTLEVDDGPLRHQQRPSLDVCGCANFGVLARPQTVPRIREQSCQPDGTGLEVDATVCEVDPALWRIEDAIAQNQLELPLLEVGLAQCGCRKAARKREVALLTGREIDLDRIKGRDRRNGAARRTHERSHLEFRDARDAIDRRGEAGETEVDLRCWNGGLGLLLGRFCRRDLSLGSLGLRLGGP